MNTLDNEDNIEKLAPSSIKKDETVSTGHTHLPRCSLDYHRRSLSLSATNAQRTSGASYGNLCDSG